MTDTRLTPARAKALRRMGDDYENHRVTLPDAFNTQVVNALIHGGHARLSRPSGHCLLLTEQGRKAVAGL